MVDSTIPPRIPVRRLTDHDIPALFGAARTGRLWRIYRELEGSLPTETPTDLGTIARDAWIDAWIGGNYLIEGEARRPTGPVDHKTLPLTVTPDITLPAAPSLGEGWAMATMATVTTRQFHQQWTKPGEPTRPPEAEILRLQSILMTTGAKWGCVIPVVDTDGFRDPIVVQSHVELQNEIARNVTELWERVQRNDPPPPDARADGKGLAALAQATEGKPKRTPTDTERAHIQDCANRMEDLQRALAEEAAAIAPLRMRLQAVEDELQTALADFGPVEVGEERLWIKARPRKARPAAAQTIDIIREPIDHQRRTNR